MRQVTIKWTLAADVLVVVSTAGDTIPQNVWDAYMDVMAKAKYARLLSASLGTTQTTSLQRQQAVNQVKSRGVPVAMVTDDNLVRGIVTAASWLGANVKAFSWSAAHEAIAYLGVTGMAQTQVLEALMQTRKACEHAR